MNRKTEHFFTFYIGVFQILSWQILGRIKYDNSSQLKNYETHEERIYELNTGHTIAIMES